MPSPTQANPDPIAEDWDPRVAEDLIADLWALRQAMRDNAARLDTVLQGLDAARRPSAVNLAHYLAMRQVDLRRLQDRLAWVGLSSLGRAESHVLANVDKVIGLLHRLLGRPWQPLSGEEPAGFHRGTALLQKHARALFGPAPRPRAVRVMVTLPSEAAHDAEQVAQMVAAGMNVARINCAHDGPAEWAAMAASVRRAARQQGLRVRVLMDIAGPKLRTGPVAAGPAVVRLKPLRDAYGRTTAPALLRLHAAGHTAAADGGPLSLGIDPDWLDRVQQDDHVKLTDTRGSARRLRVVSRSPAGVTLACDRTVYLADGILLHRQGDGDRQAPLQGVPVPPGQVHLARGDRLDLVDRGQGHDRVPAGPGRKARRATIACTLPEVLAQVREGHRIWFDDGRIGGVVRRCSGRRVEVEITEARLGGEKLLADKGINLPDTDLDLPALTAQDLKDLDTVVRHADIVGLSFAQSAQDVLSLRQQLADRGASNLGVILKVETRRGFANLPQMLLVAMTLPAAGVMIARGDLAVECGYERLAEVQEEILWACEAAHMPVVWATQVLETLAKTGVPSRAEITDAAMGGRAECVMLNKGPHILDAMQTLDDILRRMQAHQAKKRPLLRALKTWSLPTPARQGGRA